MQSHSEVEGQYFVMSSGRVCLPWSVEETVECSCESHVDIATLRLMLKRWEQKRWRSMRGLKTFCILLRWVLRPDKREDEGAVADRLCDGRSMRWGNQRRLYTKSLSKGEIHRVTVWRDRWVGGKLIVREEGWCKRVERYQRESAVIACGGSSDNWEARDVLWIVYS